MAPASRLMGWPFLLAWGAHALRRAPAPCAARSILAPAARVRRLAAAARPATACAAASDGRGSADGAAGSAEAPLYLIDALPLIYRGYYGIRGPTGSGAALSTEAGEETTALFGFVSQLAAFLSEHEPSRLVVVIDGQHASLVRKAKVALLTAALTDELSQAEAAEQRAAEAALEAASAAAAGAAAAAIAVAEPRAGARGPLALSVWAAMPGRLARLRAASGEDGALLAVAHAEAVGAGGGVAVAEAAVSVESAEAGAEGEAEAEATRLALASSLVRAQVLSYCGSLPAAPPHADTAQAAAPPPPAERSVESAASRAALSSFPAYKSSRAATPPAIRAAVRHLPELLAALGIPTLCQPLAEADDVIATLAQRQLGNQEAEWAGEGGGGGGGGGVVVVSADKDFRQLLQQGRLSLLRPVSASAGRKAAAAKAAKRDAAAAEAGEAATAPASSAVRSSSRFEEFTEEHFVAETGGLRPSAFCDLAALVGDAVDSVPGVPGLGPVTASGLLLGAGGSLESLLQAAHAQQQAAAAAAAAPKRRAPRARAAAAADTVAVDGTAPAPPTAVPAARPIAKRALSALAAHGASALLCKQLVQLDRHVPLPPGWGDGADADGGAGALRLRTARAPPDEGAARRLLERFEVRAPRVLDALLRMPPPPA